MQQSTLRRLIFLGIIFPLLLPVLGLATIPGGMAGAVSVAQSRVAPIGSQPVDPLAPQVVQFDVVVTKTASPDPTVVAGNQLVYTLTVGNNGPHSADGAGVPLTDVLPAEVSFNSVNVSAPDVAASCSHSGEASGGTVSCNLGVLGPNQTATVTITVTVDPSTPGGTVIKNQATSQPAPEDTDRTNNTSNETLTTVIAATATPRPIPVGGYGEPLTPSELLVPRFLTFLVVIGLLVMVAGFVAVRRLTSENV